MPVKPLSSCIFSVINTVNKSEKVGVHFFGPSFTTVLSSKLQTKFLIMHFNKLCN